MLKWHAEDWSLRASHLNWALVRDWRRRLKIQCLSVLFPSFTPERACFHVLSGGTISGVSALSSLFTVSNFRAISLARFLLCCWFLSLQFCALVWLSKFGDRILC